MALKAETNVFDQRRRSFAARPPIDYQRIPGQLESIWPTQLEAATGDREHPAVANQPWAALLWPGGEPAVECRPRAPQAEASTRKTSDRKIAPLKSE
jgi:hypothetical protein